MSAWLSLSKRFGGVRVGVSTRLQEGDRVATLRAERDQLLAKNRALVTTLRALLDHPEQLVPANIAIARAIVADCS